MVWLSGSLFLMGELGKWIDDYAAHHRDPVTGGFAWADVLSYPWWFYWRPIHVMLVFGLQTLLWNHDWVNHLFSACMHGLACVCAWRCARDLGVRGWVAAAGLVALLASPQGFEGVFWPATVSTTIATAAFFLAVTIVVRSAQGRQSRAGPWVLAGLGAITPCLYEQPAAAMAMLPIAFVAGVLDLERRRAGRVPGTVIGHAARMIVLLVPVAIGIGAYLAGYVLTVRRDAFARESQFADGAGLAGRFEHVLKSFVELANPSQGFGEAWEAGVARIASSGPAEWAAIAAAVVGAAAWVWRHGAVRRVGSEPGRSAGLALTGYVVFMLSAALVALVPIVVIQGAGLSSRLMYFPMACLWVGVAIALEGLLRRLTRVGGRVEIAARCGTLASVATMAGAGCVVLVGLQSMYQRRHAADMASLQELVCRLPNPRPGTVFVPVRAVVDGASARADRLRNSFVSIWQSPWAINTMVKHAYRRADVHAATIYYHNQSSGIIRIGETTRLAWSHYLWMLPTPRMMDEFPAFARELVVPLTLDERGMPGPVGSIVTRRPDGERVVFTPAQMMHGSEEGAGAPSVELALPVDDGGEWLRHWTWSSGTNAGKRVKFARLPSFGAAELAIRMHPPTPGVRIEGSDTDAMETVLPSDAGGRSVVFWATFEERTIELSMRGDGVELVWSVEGVGEVRRQRLEPGAIGEGRRWERVEVEITAAGGGARLRVDDSTGPSGTVSYDRVIVSCGSLMPGR